MSLRPLYVICDLVNSDEFGALKGTKLVAICPFCLILALFTSSKLVEEALVCISMYPQYLDLNGYTLSAKILMPKIFSETKAGAENFRRRNF